MNYLGIRPAFLWQLTLREKRSICVHSKSTMGWDINRFLDKDSLVEEIICTVCTDVVKEPVQTPCDHLFCKECITNWIEGGHKSCPIDRHQISLDMLKPPSRMIIQLINKLSIRCKHFSEGCKLMSKFEDISQLIDHETEGCKIVQNIRLGNIQKEIGALKQKNSELQETWIREKSMRSFDNDKNTQLLSKKDGKILELQKKISENEKAYKEAVSSFQKQAEHLIKLTKQFNREEDSVSRPPASVSGFNGTQNNSAINGKFSSGMGESNKSIESIDFYRSIQVFILLLLCF